MILTAHLVKLFVFSGFVKLGQWYKFITMTLKPTHYLVVQMTVFREISIIDLDTNRVHIRTRCSIHICTIIKVVLNVTSLKSISKMNAIICLFDCILYRFKPCWTALRKCKTQNGKHNWCPQIMKIQRLTFLGS